MRRVETFDGADALAWRLVRLSEHVGERKYHCAHSVLADVSCVRRLRKLLMKTLRTASGPSHDRFADTDAVFAMECVANCVRDSIVILRAVQEASLVPHVYDEELQYLDSLLRYARQYPISMLCQDVTACGGMAVAKIA